MKALKEGLWERVLELQARNTPPGAPDGVLTCKQQLSFQDVIACLPENGPAGRLSDLSVHLCFICLLHLANEHGLKITDAPSLDSLCVSNLPSPGEEVLL